MCDRWKCRRLCLTSLAEISGEFIVLFQHGAPPQTLQFSRFKSGQFGTIIHSSQWIRNSSLAWRSNSENQSVILGYNRSSLKWIMISSVLTYCWFLSLFRVTLVTRPAVCMYRQQSGESVRSNVHQWSAITRQPAGGDLADGAAGCSSLRDQSTSPSLSRLRQQNTQQVLHYDYQLVDKRCLRGKFGAQPPRNSV